MIRDLERDRPVPGTRADVCVVGAGAAGIVLAVELVRLGLRVLLLEGGGELVEASSQAPYAGETAARAYRGLHDGRIRALGGTTNLWGGQILELDGLDFERRPWVTESGWPFPKTELTASYKQALELEGVAGSRQADESVWQALSLTRPELPPLCTYLSRWCPEPNLAVVHAAALQGPAMDVWVHANVVDLQMHGEQASGVRARTLSGTEAIFEAETFVFCLGAIESSRFFLQPRGGGLPWNASGLLGKHFQDHIDCTAATVEPLPGAEKRFHNSFDAIFLDRHKYNPKLKLDEHTQRTKSLLAAGATFFSESSGDEALTAVKAAAKHLLRGRVRAIRPADIWNVVKQGPVLARHGYRFGIEHRAYHPPSAPMKMRVHCEQEPGGASSITLSKDRDQLGMLRTRLDWRISETEMRTIQEFLDVTAKALYGIARLVADAELMAGSTALCQDSFHHMGGMRMHASPRHGVVDPELRLYGTTNVSVCSSAVFPTSGFSNPTHTLLALAVRLAKRLTHEAAPNVRATASLVAHA